MASDPSGGVRSDSQAVSAPALSRIERAHKAIQDLSSLDPEGLESESSVSDSLLFGGAGENGGSERGVTPSENNSTGHSSTPSVDPKQRLN